MKRPQVEAAALAQVLRRYPQIGALLRITRNALSTNTAACLFESDGGTFFAKRYDPALRDAYSIASEHGIILQLRAARFPTPLLHANNRGDTITWLAEVPYALFGLAHGHDRYGDIGVFEPYVDREDARNAGRMLARFHGVTREGPLPPPKPFKGLTAQYLLMGEPSPEASLIQLVAGSPVLAEFLQRQEGYARLRERVSTWGAEIGPHYGELPCGITHGDWIKRNLFWQGNEVADVLDFDLWNVGPWLYDLAVALLPTGFNWPELLAGRGELDRADLQACLAGYQEERHLTPQEKALLPGFMETARIEFYLSVMATALVKGDQETAHTFWQLLIQMGDWFAAHPDWRTVLE